MFNEGGNIVSGGMKIFQVKESRPQQILILPTNVVKQLQNNGTIQATKHAFVRHIFYEQCVANVSVRKHRKENIKLLVENWLARFIW
jgi:hypothetical protein